MAKAVEKESQISKQLKTLVHLLRWQSDSFLHEGCNVANPSQSLIKKAFAILRLSTFSVNQQSGVVSMKKGQDIFISN